MFELKHYVNPKNDEIPLEIRGYSPLHMAVYNADYNEIIRLLENGFNVYTVDNYHNIPLHIAAGMNDPISTEILLKVGINQQRPHCCNSTLPILMAICTGSAESLKVFIRYGCKINDLESNAHCRWTSLHYAIFFKQNEIVKILLSEGVHINKTDASGNTPLHLACQQGNLEAVQLLFDYGAVNLINRRSYAGITPIGYTVENGHVNVYKFLLENGAYLKEMNLRGETLLHRAVIHMQYDFVKILIDEGLDVHRRTRDNRTILHYIIRCRSNFKNTVKDSIKIIDLLVAKGLNIDEKDDSGENLLSNACYYNKKELTLHCLRHGADINFRKPMYAQYNLLDLIIYFEWGFKCIETLLAFGLRFNPFYNEKQKINKPKVIKHFVRYFKKRSIIGLYVEPMDKKIVDRFSLPNFTKDCLREIKLIKEIQFSNTTSLYNFLCTTSIRGLVTHLHNDEVSRFFETQFEYGIYPIYEDIIIKNYVDGKRYLPVYDKAVESLKIASQCHWPDLISELIFNYIDVVDMKNLIEAVNHHTL